MGPDISPISAPPEVSFKYPIKIGRKDAGVADITEIQTFNNGDVTLQDVRYDNVRDIGTSFNWL